ncbi:MAG TPA: hypothetical protein VK061_08140 [Bacillota bacterium]|nr:hypothetical protein [Bacillota bacterium]
MNFVETFEKSSELMKSFLITFLNFLLIYEKHDPYPEQDKLLFESMILIQKIILYLHIRNVQLYTLDFSLTIEKDMSKAYTKKMLKPNKDNFQAIQDLYASVIRENFSLQGKVYLSEENSKPSIVWRNRQKIE